MRYIIAAAFFAIGLLMGSANVGPAVPPGVQPVYLQPLVLQVPEPPAEHDALLDYMAELQPGMTLRDAFQIRTAILEAAEQYQVDPLLILSVAFHESSLNPRARGRKGEIGLMQLMPFHAKGRDLRNIRTNILVGTAYLAENLKRYGTIEYALLAYNRGPGTVNRVLRAGGNPHNGYAHRVLAAYNKLKITQRFGLDV